MRVDEPAVSVVIAAYNASATIAEQLAALSRQDVPFSFEVLVCDNGSTDDTAAVARSWANRLPGLVVIDASARRGPGAARNIGVSQARGRHIAFCDADDVVADDWLAELYSTLQTAEFVAARIEHRRLNPQYPDYLQGAEGMMFTIKPLTQYPMVGAGHMAVHKGVFDEVGGFDESMRTAEDLDLSWRIQLAGHPLVGNPRAVVHIRIRPTLRGVFLQAYGYGSAHRMLHHKYARVFAAQTPHASTADPAPEPDGGAGDPPSRVRRVAARAGRAPRKLVKIVRDPLELAPLVRRSGMRLGKLMSRYDPAAAQLSPNGS